MVSNRHLRVILDGKISKRLMDTNGLAHGSVLTDFIYKITSCKIENSTKQL